MSPSKAVDPLALCTAWLAEAAETEPDVPTAMALATADGAGSPSVRMVLLKEIDDRGIVFYTNAESRKARELDANPKGVAVPALEEPRPANSDRRRGGARARGRGRRLLRYPSARRSDRCLGISAVAAHRGPIWT